jgi:hypothetical protein
MVEIGQIHRPSADEFTNKKKLYCVANIYAVEDAPEDFKELVNRYWDEVVRQIEKIETAGKVRKIFCEVIYKEGDDALEMLAQMNEHIPRMIRKKLDEGSCLIPLELRELLGPYTDWGNCLRVVFTREVFDKVLSFYTEFAEKRLRHILDVIEQNLSETEAGLLIMKDEDRAKLQFPKDIEIFLITPPSYDDIMRWFRARFMKQTATEEAG